MNETSWPGGLSAARITERVEWPTNEAIVEGASLRKGDAPRSRFHHPIGQPGTLLYRPSLALCTPPLVHKRAMAIARVPPHQDMDLVCFRGSSLAKSTRGDTATRGVFGNECLEGLRFPLPLFVHRLPRFGLLQCVRPFPTRGRGPSSSPMLTTSTAWWRGSFGRGPSTHGQPALLCCGEQAPLPFAPVPMCVLSISSPTLVPAFMIIMRNGCWKRKQAPFCEYREALSPSRREIQQKQTRNPTPLLVKMPNREKRNL